MDYILDAGWVIQAPAGRSNNTGHFQRISDLRIYTPAT
jgi:hypothetical protein